MKKTLIALAAVAATGAAFAQSTVTLYGNLDTAYTQYKNGTSKITGLSGSQMTSSLIGFRGEEDLGGGLKGIFKLEGSLSTDAGNGSATNTNNQPSGAGTTSGTATGFSGAQGLAFNRYAHVGVAGSFGEVRLGRDYTSAFQWGVAAADVFGTNGPVSGNNMMLNLAVVNKQATASGASNMIGYITPNMNGFEAKIQAFSGENKSDSTTVGSEAKAGDGTSIAVKYSKGPVMVAYGTQTTKGTVAAAVTSTSVAANGEYQQSGLSASYDLGVAKVIYTNAKESLIKTAGESTNKTNLFGVVVPMGAINLKASYAMSKMNVVGTLSEGTQIGFGADYSLSKRTMAYFAYSQVENTDSGAAYYTGVAGTAANNKSTGVAIGVRHSF
jgi:predicted porin